MIIKTVRKSQWEDTLKQIRTNGRRAPLTKQYDIEVNCNGMEYILKVQPTHGRKIVALQALAAVPGDVGFEGETYGMVEDNCVIAALLELVIFQGAEKRSA